MGLVILYGIFSPKYSSMAANNNNSQISKDAASSFAYPGKRSAAEILQFLTESGILNRDAVEQEMANKEKEKNCKIIRLSYRISRGLMGGGGLM